MTIKRKWELISDELESIDSELAKRAKVIDSIIDSFYDHHTKEWIKDYPSITERLNNESDSRKKLLLIRKVACNPDYCSCCYLPNQESILCDSCKLAEFDKQCCEGDSLYYSFIVQLNRKIKSFRKGKNHPSLLELFKLR